MFSNFSVFDKRVLGLNSGGFFVDVGRVFVFDFFVVFVVENDFFVLVKFV